MSYCTQQNMIDRFGADELVQLTDRALPANNVIDPVVLNNAIEDASGIIDGYLQSRYTLPLALVPRALVRIACDVTRYYLYDDLATEQVKQRFDAAVDFLKQVSNGRVTLGPDQSGGQAQTNNSAQIKSGGNVFDRNNSKGFI